MKWNTLATTLSRLCLIVTVVSLAGCTVEKVEGNTTTFTFAPWVTALVFVGGLAVMPVGWFLRRWSSRWGWTVLIMGPVALVFVGPGILTDRVTVDDQHFHYHSGFWFSPMVYDVSFDSLARIEIVSQKRSGRGGEREDYYLLCHRKTGGGQSVPVGDLMGQGAAAKILETAQRRGVLVVDRTEHAAPRGE